MTNFERVSEMNEAFGNPKGNPAQIDIARIRNQMKSILDEYGEFLQGIDELETITDRIGNDVLPRNQEQNDLVEYEKILDKVRDAIVDIQVFAYGAQHLMGIDANRDMESVIAGVMTRFCRNEEELQATQEKFAAKGVTETYTVGEFPKMILRSAVDQPDAPKDKFLKSVGYSEPVFYSIFDAE